VFGLSFSVPAYASMTYHGVRRSGYGTLHRYAINSVGATHDFSAEGNNNSCVCRELLFVRLLSKMPTDLLVNIPTVYHVAADISWLVFLGDVYCHCLS